MQSSRLKISLAIAVYNGEAFLSAQLESVLRQTRPVDEVIICDDGSTDETPQLVRAFIHDNGLEDSWFYHINNTNKGAAVNFVDCALMTTGDVIFYCDQDDVWYADKIERMLDVFERRPEVKLLSSNTAIVDEKGKPLSTSYSRLKFVSGLLMRGKLSKISFCEQIRSNNDCPGHEMAFRREVIEACAHIIKKGLSHDNPLGFIMSAKGGYYRLHTKLMNRRLHSGNTSIPQYDLASRVRRPDIQIKGREAQNRLIDGCYDAVKGDLSEREKMLLFGFRQLTENSIAWIKEKRLVKLFAAMFSLNPMVNKTIMAINLLCAFHSGTRSMESTR